MYRMSCKSIVINTAMMMWSVCHVAMAIGQEVNPPMSMRALLSPHEAQRVETMLVSPAYLAPEQYIIIEVPPAAGHGYSKGYGINNLSQVSGRTYNYNEVSQQVEDQRALFWDLRTGSRTLSTLDGTSGGWGLNDTGTATGFSTNADGNQRAVRWNLSDGSILDMGTLANPWTEVPGSESYAYGGINNSHKVVGHSEIPNDPGDFIPFHAFIYDADGLRDLGTLTTNGYYMDGYSIAYDITEADAVVGIARIAGWLLRPFIWTEAEGMSELAIDALRASGEWYAATINESGMIGGHAIDGNGTYPYYWPSKDDVPIAINMPVSHPYAELYSVNESGQMVGGMFNDTEEDRAFLFDSTNGVIDLNDRIGAGSGWLLQVAIDINDMGQITGYGERNGANRAFVLTPSADTDNDNDIDGSDIAALVQELGQTGCNGGCAGDFNDDNNVDAMDVFLQAMVLGHTG